MLLTPAVRVRIYTSLSRRDELIIALVRQEEIIHSKHGMAWHGSDEKSANIMSSLG
jgi:hypothetical protein